MTRWYKAPNKRGAVRGSHGRFNQGTLADIGFACCEVCGALFAPRYPDAQFIDPRDMREARRLCPDHGGQGEKTGLVAVGKATNRR